MLPTVWWLVCQKTCLSGLCEINCWPLTNSIWTDAVSFKPLSWMALIEEIRGMSKPLLQRRHGYRYKATFWDACSNAVIWGLDSAVTRLSAPFQGTFAEGTERIKGFMWRRMREGGYTQAIISDNHLEMQRLDLVLLENWPACPSLLTWHLSSIMY